MKEASGEANMTVVTIILIGVIVAIATPLIQSLMTNTARKSCCTNAGGKVVGTSCVDPTNDAPINDGWNSQNKTCGT